MAEEEGAERVVKDEILTYLGPDGAWRTAARGEKITVAKSDLARVDKHNGWDGIERADGDAQESPAPAKPAARGKQ